MYLVNRRRKVYLVLAATFLVLQIFHLRSLLSGRAASKVHNLKYFTVCDPYIPEPSANLVV